MPGTDMDANIRQLLRRLEAAGLKHDAAETEHSRKLLNLEPATAEVVAMLLQIAGTRNVLEIGTSNGYSTIWLAATIGSAGGRCLVNPGAGVCHACASLRLSACKRYPLPRSAARESAPRTRGNSMTPLSVQACNSSYPSRTGHACQRAHIARVTQE